MTKLEKEYAQWRQENKEFGVAAFNRFMMMKFLAALEEAAPGRYIFKGGNLLHFYIKTPRPTVDLDFCTDTATEAADVLKDIEATVVPEVDFKVVRHSVVENDLKIGLGAIIEFTTKSGAQNRFGIDVVFAIPTHQTKIKILNKELKAASIENIILDKLAAIERFGTGNTRMKDFDDLFRIAISNLKPREEVLNLLAKERGLDLKITVKVNEHMAQNWKNFITSKHYKDAKDLPSDLAELIVIVNQFLKVFQK